MKVCTKIWKRNADGKFRQLPLFLDTKCVLREIFIKKLHLSWMIYIYNLNFSTEIKFFWQNFSLLMEIEGSRPRFPPGMFCFPLVNVTPSYWVSSLLYWLLLLLYLIVTWDLSFLDRIMHSCWHITFLTPYIICSIDVVIKITRII